MDRYSSLINSYGGDLLAEGRISLDDPDADYYLGDTDRYTSSDEAEFQAVLDEAFRWEVQQKIALREEAARLSKEPGKTDSE